MSDWPATKGSKVFRALINIGWQLERQHGSHVVLTRKGWPNFIWAFHNNEEIGPRMLARIAKKTGITPEDL